MLTEFEAHISRRLAPTTVRLRMFWIKKFAAHHPLETASTDDMYDFLDSNPDWSAATLQTIVSTFKVFYRWAFVAELIEKDPATRLERVKVPRKVSRIASDLVILSGLSRASLQDEAMLRLGAEGGLRVAEIAHLHRRDRNGRWLSVTGKGGMIRSVYLSVELAEVLDRLEMQRHGYYFPGRYGEAVAPSTVWRHVRKLTGLNTHALRHRAGTSVYRGTGNDLRLAQEFLGHASPVTTAIYVHVERDQLMQASDASRLPRAA